MADGYKAEIVDKFIYKKKKQINYVVTNDVKDKKLSQL